jgi:hypothetical protein
MLIILGFIYSPNCPNFHYVKGAFTLFMVILLRDYYNVNINILIKEIIYICYKSTNTHINFDIFAI